MYKIPEEFKISEIINEEINQIGFGLNYVTLFYNKGFIQFSGSFSFQHSGRKDDFNEVYPVKDDFGLLKLLGKKITQIKTNDGRNILILWIDHNIILKLIGSKEYESYIINIHGKEVIV